MTQEINNNLPVRYNCLSQQVFDKGEFSIIPIRYTDRHDIMKWRNEQIYHLRQSVVLTEQAQEDYFLNVIPQFFSDKKPPNILFSFLQNRKLVGYGGLVHINWLDRNAELSFLMDTNLEKEHFQEFWVNYLNLISQVAFDELKLHKIYIYAFDVRPNLYKAAEAAGFFKDATLTQHSFIQGQVYDVVIYSKIKKLS